uniref:Large ribosomal subunit protein bL28c n=1 Tax=Cyanidium sp. THAL103 TaxID=3027999 RepID=A0A9Y1I454_9RHOD|nr:ribosomal protein L28 [Cyanidium sp. THAL103]
MTKKCDLTGKKSNNGYTVTYSHKRNKKLQFVNLQKKRIWSNKYRKFFRLKLSVKVIRSLKKFGLEQVLDSNLINLHNI